MMARQGRFGLLLVILAAACTHPAPPAGATGPQGLLAEGVQTPDLQANDQEGHAHHLAEARGHWTVVYFYPKDDTPGCTKEACAFRDVWQRYEAAGVRVYGVSTQDVASKHAFAEKYKLPLPLLADTDERWAQAFGVPVHLGFSKRVTFLLDPRGVVAKVYPSVDVGLHAGQILADVEALKK